ncbi:hypothetical protein D3C84_628710 [compost metagenome]
MPACVDAGVTRGVQLHIHQRKPRVEQALGCPQGKVENPFKYQDGVDGLVCVALAVSPLAVVVVYCIRSSLKASELRLIRGWVYDGVQQLTLKLAR